jgi:NADPH-dependent ferric siderophore reductase
VLSAVLTTLDITRNSHVFAKSSDRSELLQLVVEAVATAQPGTSVDLVVTGDAATVNAVRRTIKSRPDLTPRIKARAYWASGRTGLS